MGKQDMARGLWLYQLTGKNICKRVGRLRRQRGEYGGRFSDAGEASFAVTASRLGGDYLFLRTTRFWSKDVVFRYDAPFSIGR
jgi:hypothetical protein